MGYFLAETVIPVQGSFSLFSANALQLPAPLGCSPFEYAVNLPIYGGDFFKQVTQV